ncbi:MAG: hypothetical protein IKH30_11105 [Clostridia bacterium]|nr:hypothetical protein [Clostridia bacterium]
MKDAHRFRTCGCGRFAARPEPPRPRPLPPEKSECGCAPPPPSCGEYLMQRILASGRVYRRRTCYPVSLNALPEQARPPFTVLDAASCYAPCWEELPCRDRRGITLLVTVPLTLRVRDGNGCVYTVSTEIQEELRLRCLCPDCERWRGQPIVQASARLAGRPCPCDCVRCEVPLEVSIEGYLVAPCAVGGPEPPCHPRPLPWYPEPIYDPYN